ncbi:MAG: NTP/NDP exchange transporter [Rickettsiales bacterium]|nr:NTP/NDP exchange transporter [Rickettsiales bacterium]
MTSSSINLLKSYYNSFRDNQEYILKKVLPTSIIFLIIIFVYSVVRGAKDTLVVPISGAEILSALKLFGVLPSSVVFVVIYSKLTNMMNSQKLFYALTTFFITFFASYAFLLYPIRESLDIDLSDIIADYPSLKLPLLMVSHWSSSLFYIMAELWGSAMLSLMFWQFANHIYKVSEAKNTYTIFGAIGQIGLIAAGIIQKYTSISNTSLSNPLGAWESTLQSMMFSVFVAGLIMMAIFWYMNKFVLTDPRFFDKNAEVNKKKNKPKMSLIESFKYIFQSKYIGLIAVLVLTYGVSINLVEGVWKNQLKIQFPVQNDYSAFMGSFQIWTGVASMIGMILGVYILRTFKWRTSAILTPLMILITGGLFFLLILAGSMFEAALTLIGTTSLMMAVIMGATQNILSKSTKYSLFDPTKEMTYIPLDSELKSKGKAVVDVTGARLGKSGGAMIQFLLITLIPGANLSNLTEDILYIFLVIMACWIMAVFALSKLFEEKMKEKNDS